MFSNLFKYRALCQVKSVMQRGGRDTKSQGRNLGIAALHDDTNVKGLGSPGSLNPG